jgi:WD40 repeat protein
VASGKERVTLRGHLAFVMAVAFRADGKSLASGDAGGVVKFWDVAADR